MIDCAFDTFERACLYVKLSIPAHLFTIHHLQLLSSSATIPLLILMLRENVLYSVNSEHLSLRFKVSNILKKIKSIEPDDTDILDAINANPEKQEKVPLISSIEDVDDALSIDAEPSEYPLEDIKQPIDNIPPSTPEYNPREEGPNITVDTPIAEADSPLAEEETYTVDESVNDEAYSLSISENIPAVELAAAATIAKAQPAKITSKKNWITFTGIALTLIWIAASFSYFYGFFELRQKWTDLSPIQIFGLIMAILLPAILLAILFYSLRQLSKLSAESHDLKRAAFQLSQPDESAIAKTSLMSSAIKSEIDSVDARIDQALARMSSLEDVVKERTLSLKNATGNTAHTTDEIASRLSTQRLALESIADAFDTRMNLLSSSLSVHSENLDESTKVAEQKIQEARVSVEGAAQRINEASGVVRGNTIDAASTLAQSQEEIENLAKMIRQRSAELDEVYRKHAQDLTGMIAQLRDEQQNLSVSLDERLSKMRDMSLAAKVSAESLTDASHAGRQTVEALATATRLTDTAVKQRFQEMEDMVKFSTEKANDISGNAARQVQNSLSQTRQEIARIEDDMLAMQSRLSAPTQKFQPAQEAPKPKKPKKRSKKLKLRPVSQDPVSHDNVKSNFAGSVTDKQTKAEDDELTIPSLRSSIGSNPINFTNEKLNLEVNTENTLSAKERSSEPLPPLNLGRADIVEPVETQNILKKSKSGWGLKSMLGAFDRSPPPIASTVETIRKQSHQNISDELMISLLSSLGLAPAAIIDDGCIIEATNTRTSKGANAMSNVVSRRIGGPIRHLQRAMDEDISFKSNARAYVAQFNAGISAIETNREAIRTRLETDAGRAFLLCDAALNG